MKIVAKRDGYKSEEEDGDEDEFEFDVDELNQEPNSPTAGSEDEEVLIVGPSVENTSLDNADTKEPTTEKDPESEESCNHEHFKAHHDKSTTLNTSLVSVNVEVHDHKTGKDFDQVAKKTCKHVSEAPEPHSDNLSLSEMQSETGKNEDHRTDRNAYKNMIDTAEMHAPKDEMIESGTFENDPDFSTETAHKQIPNTVEFYLHEFSAADEPTKSEKRQGSHSIVPTKERPNELERIVDADDNDSINDSSNESGRTEKVHCSDSTNMKSNESGSIQEVRDCDLTYDKSNEYGGMDDHDSGSTNMKSKESENIEEGHGNNSSNRESQKSETTEEGHDNDSVDSRKLKEDHGSSLIKDNLNESRDIEEDLVTDFTNESRNMSSDSENGHQMFFLSTENLDLNSQNEKASNSLELSVDTVSVANDLKESGHIEEYLELDSSSNDLIERRKIQEEMELDLIQSYPENDSTNFHKNLSIIYETNADTVLTTGDFEESRISEEDHGDNLKDTSSHVSHTPETVSVNDGASDSNSLNVNADHKSSIETVSSFGQVIFNSHDPERVRKVNNHHLQDMKGELHTKRRSRRSSASISCVPTHLRDEHSISLDGKPREERSSSLPILVLTPPLDPRNSFLRSLPPAIARDQKKLRAGDAMKGLALIVSAMYGKMIMIMGMAFPLAELISEHVTDSYYEVFYMYLYFGSILFLLYVNFFILQKKSTKRIVHGLHLNKDFAIGYALSVATSEARSRRDSLASVSDIGVPKQRFNRSSDNEFGSNLYLRIGAVAFGIGAVVYAILEFSQLLELYILDICHNFPMLVTPALRCIFIFLQMYFIFLNSRILIQKYVIIARFGLMHVIATNICTWFDVLVNQSKHDILAFAIKKNEDANNHIGNSTHGADNIPHVRYKSSSLDAKLQRDECWSSSPNNILTQLVSNAAPFFYPYTIEYSLICATVLCIMWKNIGRGSRVTGFEEDDDSKHKYTLDCSKAHKGLFVGILILTLSVVSLILYFAMIDKEEYREVAILEKNVAELLLYVVGVVAVAVAYFQMDSLQYDIRRNLEIENMLLIIAQTGLYIYAVYLIIGGIFNLGQDASLTLVIGLAKMVQTTMQTIFILDASRRRASNEDDEKLKPGRECVTMLLMANISMWMINKFEMSREVHPAHIEFYGPLAWTILSHTTMPLAIFYRFHSTVCLGDIWTRAYKIKKL